MQRDLGCKGNRANVSRPRGRMHTPREAFNQRSRRNLSLSLSPLSLVTSCTFRLPERARESGLGRPHVATCRLEWSSHDVLATRERGVPVL